MRNRLICRMDKKLSTQDRCFKLLNHDFYILKYLQCKSILKSCRKRKRRNRKRRKNRKRKRKSIKILWRTFRLLLFLASHIRLSISEFSLKNTKIHPIVNLVGSNCQENSDTIAVQKVRTASSFVQHAKYALKTIFWDLWYLWNNSKITLCTAKTSTAATAASKKKKWTNGEFGTVVLAPFQYAPNAWTEPTTFGRIWTFSRILMKNDRW